MFRISHFTDRQGDRPVPTRSWRRRRAAAAIALVAAALTLPAAPAHADTYDIRISNLRSGLNADVMWASTSAYQGVFLWPTNSSASQKFDILDSGGGFFRIRARHSGQCLMLDWRQGNYNGTRIMQYPHCTAGYSPGEWRRGWVSNPPVCNGNICSQTGTQYPVLINRFSGRCVDAANGSSNPPPAQAVLQQWDCIRWASDWNAGNQLWRFGNEGYL
jgi:Ricin-type beta-trefoil lectin domain-like